MRTVKKVFESCFNNSQKLFIVGISVSCRYMVIVKFLRNIDVLLRSYNTPHPCLYKQITYRSFSGPINRAKLSFNLTPVQTFPNVKAVSPIKCCFTIFTLNVWKKGGLVNSARTHFLWCYYAFQSHYILQTKYNFTSCCESPISPASLKNSPVLLSEISFVSPWVFLSWSS